jgi:hypothetical protein
MSRGISLIAGLLLCSAFFGLAAQEHDAGYNPAVIRGEVWIELEPVYGGRVDTEYPLSVEAAGRRALEEAALFYSAMIYGWSFHYEVGEKARRIDESFELEPVASIPFGDPGLQVTATEYRDMRLRLWTDYRLTGAQQRRMHVWRTGTIRSAQAVGYSPLGGPSENADWLLIRKSVLEAAARNALRTMLRGSERNRPKEISGFISLASFPRYFIDKGQWAASARFRLQINEIIPFAAY